MWTRLRFPFTIPDVMLYYFSILETMFCRAFPANVNTWLCMLCDWQFKKKITENTNITLPRIEGQLTSPMSDLAHSQLSINAISWVVKHPAGVALATNGE